MISFLILSHPAADALLSNSWSVGSDVSSDVLQGRKGSSSEGSWVTPCSSFPLSTVSLGTHVDSVGMSAWMNSIDFSPTAGLLVSFITGRETRRYAIATRFLDAKSRSKRVKRYNGTIPSTGSGWVSSCSVSEWLPCQNGSAAPAA